MKILERLRDLAHERSVEPSDVQAGYEVASLDYESIEYASVDEAIVGDPLPSASFSRHTVSGLRRRIPDVHEDIPPDGYEISEQSESFEAE